ncbi:MFS transporter [Kineococcus terrestris]|uniref:MFS transporter n=1 Tax=Kineococcus terrestris TaxID=2044856 RepID=UPI0034DB63B3
MDLDADRVEMKDYLGVLRNPRAARPFAAAVVARLPVSMAPLGLVLLVRGLRDDWTLAGVVAGAFAVGVAVGSPFWGRGLDRYGQPRVIAATSCASAAFLLALTLATAGPVPGPALVVLAALVGGTFPPVSPAMRAAWRVVLPDVRQQRLGYALDAVAVETLFVGGPLLLTLLLAVTSPLVPMLATCAFLAGGGLLYARTEAARSLGPGAVPPPTPEPGPAGDAAAAPGPPATAPPVPTPVPAPRGRGRSTREVPVALTAGVPAALLVLAAMSIGFGLLDVSLAGLAEVVLGSPDKLGFMFAAIASGSALGGLLYGARQWRSEERLRLPVILGGFGSGTAVLAVVAWRPDPSMLVLVPVLFCAGLFISPNLIVLQSLVDHLAPRHRLGEAQAWLSTSVTAGGAVGNALAGRLIDTTGPQLSLAAAAAAVLLGAALALLAQPRWRALLRPAPGAAVRLS